MLALADVHHRHAEAMIAERERNLQQAWAQTHGVHGKPKPRALPREFWINRPVEETSPEEGQ